MIRAGQVVFTYFHFAASARVDQGDGGKRSSLHRLRDNRTARTEPPCADPDERGRRANGNSRGRKIPRTPDGGQGNPAWRGAGGCAGECRHPRRRGERAPMPPRWPPGSERTLLCSISTSTACATSMTSCRPTSERNVRQLTTSEMMLRSADLVIGAVLSMAHARRCW